MDNDLCPICGKKHNIALIDKGRRFDCAPDKQYCVNDSVFWSGNQVETERRLNAIYNYIETKPFLQKGGLNYNWNFYYDENKLSKLDDSYVNVFFLMQDYPKDVVTRIDRILLNLARYYPLLSDTFTVKNCVEKFRVFYCESKAPEAEINSLISMLEELNYIKWRSDIKNYDNEGRKYSITVKGWEKISQLRQLNEVTKQGFIAMSFDPQVKYIEDCFKKAISEAGYKPQIIKDKEHNNYIMPEIFYEIKQSRFVVVDITKPNYGAYYEAGYAQALGKEVIVCCKQEVFDNSDTRPHFDIAQKSMIIWKDEEDLVVRLKNRIIATVNQ